MGTNDAQISYKMPACYGVNLPIRAKAIKINIFVQNGIVEVPRDLHANFRGKTLRDRKVSSVQTPSVNFFFLNKIFKHSWAT